MSTNLKSVALVLAAHGDRGGPSRNEALAKHVIELASRNRFAFVSGGVLNGEPAIEEALESADASGAAQIVIYPMFMSAGYFVKTVLAERVEAAGLRTPTGILQPLGLDARVPLLLLESALKTAKAEGADIKGARLLIAAHGSANGNENAEATKRAARLMAPHSPFARVETAFLEESPYVKDALERYSGSSIVAGFFTGEGMHAGEDIPQAIEESGAQAIYTGPVGLSERIPDLILSSVSKALSDPEQETEAAPAPAAAPVVQAEASPAPQDEQEVIKPAKRKRRGFGFGRFMLKAAFTLALMAGLAIAAIAFLVPQDVVRDQVTSLVKQQTGRTLLVKGDTSFSVFPNVGVELEDVSISNPPGMAEGETMRMESLNLNLKLMPLLTRQVEVDRFILTKPVFNLLVDAKGNKNWDMGNKAASIPKPQRNAGVVLHATGPGSATRIAQAGGLAGGMVQEISLGTAKIIDGTLIYKNEQAGSSERLDKLNVTLVQPSRGDPLDADGSMVWKKEEITFKGRVEDLQALISNKPTATKADISTRLGEGNFNGQVTLGTAFAAKGNMAGKTPSLRSLARWLGADLPESGGLGAVSITGQLGIANETVTFSNAKLGIDGMKGEGQVSVRLKGVRPHVTASLNLDKLDLNPYLQQAGASVPAQRPAAPAPAPAPEPGKQKSLTDFIDKLNKTEDRAPQPQVRAWNQRAIDLTGLRSVDADVKLNSGALFYKNIKTGQSSVDATLKSGVLNADLKKLALYSGTGTGRVTVNGARGVPAITALFNLNNISALPLLQDATGFKWISGKANMAISLAGTGRSQSEIMRSLQGQGNFAFANGAIEGINIPAMVRGLKQGQFSGWKSSSREKTDFSSLTATFQVQQGIAYNKDLSLIGPLIRMTGQGNIDIGREQVDYAALPRIVANLQGQGAADEGRGIAVPVRITGPWSGPRVKPDLERLLRDPELAKETVNKLGKAFKKLKKKEDVNKLLEGVLGGGNQQTQGGAQPQGQQVKPKDLLKNLLNQ